MVARWILSLAKHLQRPSTRWPLHVSKLCGTGSPSYAEIISFRTATHFSRKPALVSVLTAGLRRWELIGYLGQTHPLQRRSLNKRFQKLICHRSHHIESEIRCPNWQRITAARLKITKLGHRTWAMRTSSPHSVLWFRCNRSTGGFDDTVSQARPITGWR